MERLFGYDVCLLDGGRRPVPNESGDTWLNFNRALSYTGYQQHVALTQKGARTARENPGFPERTVMYAWESVFRKIASLW